MDRLEEDDKILEVEERGMGPLGGVWDESNGSLVTVVGRVNELLDPVTFALSYYVHFVWLRACSVAGRAYRGQN